MNHAKCLTKENIFYLLLEAYDENKRLYKEIEKLKEEISDLNKGIDLLDLQLAKERAGK